MDRPQATIKNKLTIGANVTVGIGAVVIRDVEPDSTVVGNPAQPVKDYGRAWAERRTKLGKDGPP